MKSSEMRKPPSNGSKHKPKRRFYRSAMRSLVLTILVLILTLYIGQKIFV